MFHFYRPMRAASYRASCRVKARHISVDRCSEHRTNLHSVIHVLIGTMHVLSHEYVSSHTLCRYTSNC